MILRNTHDSLTWIDLESPTEEEIATITKEYGLSPLIAHELSTPSARPKIDIHKEYIYLILHFPTVERRRRDDGRMQEIDFIVGKQYIITTHYEAIDALYEYEKRFEADALLNTHPFGGQAGYLLFLLLRQLYVSLEEQLGVMSEDLRRAEKRVFHNEEERMVHVLSELGRSLLLFRMAIKPHKEMLESFEQGGIHLLGQEFRYHLSAIAGNYYKVWNLLEGNKEILTSLRETNDSLLTTKNNQTMVHLTMMAFVVFPLTLIAAIFSMDARAMPIIGRPNDFWIILGIMVVAMMLIFSFFKYRRWL